MIQDYSSGCANSLVNSQQSAAFFLPALLPLIQFVSSLLLQDIVLEVTAFWMVTDFYLLIYFKLPVFLQLMVRTGGHTFPQCPGNQTYHFFEDEEYIENLGEKNEYPALFACQRPCDLLCEMCVIGSVSLKQLNATRNTQWPSWQ